MAGILSKGQYFVRLLVSILAISILPLLLLSVVLFTKARSNMEKQLFDHTQNYLAQTVNAMEVVFTQIEDSGRQVLIGAELREFENFTDGNGMERMIRNLNVAENLKATARYLSAKANMFEQFRKLSVTNEFIDSIYFFDSEKELVFASSGLQYDMLDFFDTEWFSIAGEPFLSPCLFNTRDVLFPQGSKQVITLVFRSYYKDHNLMAVYIDAEAFYRNIVLEIAKESDNTLFAYSVEGDIILQDHRKKELAGLLAGFDACYPDISSWQIVQHNKNRYLLSGCESEKLGWHFVMVTDIHKYNQNLKALGFVFTAVLAALLLCVLLASALSSQKLYRPVSKLMAAVGKHDHKAERWKNEFESLAGAFEEMQINELQLTEKLQNSLPVHKKRFLISLLRRNEYDINEILRQFRLLNISLKPEGFQTILISYDDLEENDTFSQLSLKKDLLIHYLVDHLDSYHFELIEMEEEKIAVIVNVDSLQKKQLPVVLENIQKELSKEAHIYCFIAIGIYVESPLMLHQAYLSAGQAMMRRIVNSTQAVVVAGEQSTQADTLLYSKEQIDRILEELLLGKADGAKQLFREMLKEIVQSNKTVDPVQVRIFYADVVTSVLKRLNDSGIMAGNIGGEGRDLYLELGELDSIGAILKWFDNFLTAAANALSQLSVSENELRIAKIMAIIDEDCSQNTNLESVSRRLGLNPAYVSRIFKQETGMKFVEYLTRARMEKSKEYLIESEMRLKDICAALGYANINYYIKLFKDHTGVTPGDYRKKASGKLKGGHNEALK